MTARELFEYLSGKTAIGAVTTGWVGPGTDGLYSILKGKFGAARMHQTEIASQCILSVTHILRWLLETLIS